MTRSRRRDAAAAESCSWDRLAELLRGYQCSAQDHGAILSRCTASSETIVLRVDFDDDRSQLTVDLHRPSWSMCVGFGQRASVSDYPISPSWLTSTCRAVARGGWKEETFSWRGLRLRSVATLRILGRDATFTDHGWRLPAALAPRPARVVEHAPWARRG